MMNNLALKLIKFTIFSAVFVAVSTGFLQAGQSLVLTPGVSISPIANANLPASQSWRVEFQLHNWAPPSISTDDGFFWDLNGIGANAAIMPDGSLRLTDKRDAASACGLSLAGRSNVLVRFQRDVTRMRVVCELWNSDGSAYQQSTEPIQSFLDWPYSNGGFGSPYTTAKMGFFRIFSSILPDGSRPPVTADTGNLLDFKFDGNLNDSSGSGHSTTSASAVFENTPNQMPAAFLKTAGAPAWSSWVSLRAGYPAMLDGTSSFSLADAGSAVTYKWQQPGGPTTVRWSDYTAATPTIRGLVFGTYRFQLQVTDAGGKTATAILDVGAVATDDNGVVIQANPAADIIFGPMIAFGKNPWPWQDQMALHAATVRAPQIARESPPTWAGNLPGTISFQPAYLSQPQQTQLASALSATDTSIRVANASKLDLTSFPMVVYVYSANSYHEEVRICSSSGNTLNVCYDGRAWHAAQYEEVPSPQAWPSGTNVSQFETVGTGTNFLSMFCPAGPGEEGQIVYSAGTVAVTAGSATVTGSGTTWGGTLESDRIRIQGTHGGVPFVFFANVTTINSATSIALGRNWPADADTAIGLTYTVLQGGRRIVRQWIRPDSTSGQQSDSVSSCESDTRVYHSNVFSGIIGSQVNQNYSYWSDSWISEFGPNYYDEVLGEYAGYFRSGYGLFLNNARAIGDYWPKSPDFDEGYVGTFPRRTGATGIAAAAVLDGRTGNWNTLRKLANNALADTNISTLPSATNASCDHDLRETAYELSWVSLAALFDPVDTGNPADPNQRSFWKAQLDKTYLRDLACKGANSEYPTTYWTGTGGPYTMTKGSATVTGTAIPPTLCAVAGTGTISVSSGSQSGSGTGFAANTKIVIIGQRLGQPYLFYSSFAVNSSTSITLASPFDGDSGVYQYQIESDQFWLSFASPSSDIPGNMDKFHGDVNTLYACQWVGPTAITLDRPWSGISGSTYFHYRYQELGYGIQPFFDGIKTLAMKFAAQGASGATAAGYATLAKNTANWVLTTGFDPVTGGLHYAREWAGCEPNLNPRLNCTYGPDPNSRQSARFLNGEAQNAMRVAYEANPTAQTRDFGDRFYGAQWGKLGGPYFDDVYLSNIENDATWSYKWLGFLFGIGMSHQWPAVRLGGVQPAIPVNPSITFNLAGVPGAVSARILITQPSGAKTVTNCPASPCQVAADRRQGDHWFQIGYVGADGNLLLQSLPDILAVN